MNQADLLKILEEHKAIILNTHVVYTSGKHGNAYINKDAIYPDTRAVSVLCAAIADHFIDVAIEVVAAPAIGGVILSQWVAHHLSARQGNVLSVYAEKDQVNGFTFRRGYDHLLDQRRVLVVEDILTTGGSIREVIRAVRRAGSVVVGAAALCNRGAVTAQEIDNPPTLYTLAQSAFDSWDADVCPLCAQGVPI